MSWIRVCSGRAQLVEVDDGWKSEGDVGKELVDWRFHAFLRMRWMEREGA
jgi:hypothetical protein